MTEITKTADMLDTLETAQAAPYSAPVDGSRGLEGSRAYEVYARVNGRTSAEQIEHDRAADPINLRRPYLAWMDKLMDEFSELFPRRVHLGNHGPYVDGDAFNDWLEAEWEPRQNGTSPAFSRPDAPTRR
jgi:hypothetical protein